MTILEALRQVTTSIKTWVEGKLTDKADTDGTVANATKATQDSAGQQIDSTYIKALTVSGNELEYTKGDGTTATIDLQGAPVWYGTTTGGGTMAQITTSTGDFAVTAGNMLFVTSTGQMATSTFVVDGKSANPNEIQNLQAGTFLYVVQNISGTLKLVRIAGTYSPSGNASTAGVLKLSDAVNSTSSINSGVAATPKAVKTAYDLAYSKADPYPDASTSTKGVTTLSTSVTSTSTTTAAASVAVKVAYDLATTKADASHTHTADDITTAIPLDKGGTGGTTADEACTNLDVIGVKGLTIKHNREANVSVAASSTATVEITYGCTYSAAPSVIVGFGCGASAASIGDISIFASSSRVDGATITISNNTSTKRTIRPIWIAIGTV